MIIVSGCTNNNEITLVDDISNNQNRKNLEEAEIRDKMDKMELTDWSIYRNEELGYLMAYPDTWECEDPTEDNYYVTCKNVARNKLEGSIPVVKINAIKNSDIIDPIEFLKSKYEDSIYGSPIPEELNYEISNKKALKISFIEGNDAFGKNEVIRVYVNVDEKLINIEAHVDIFGEQKETIELMLNTITFE